MSQLYVIHMLVAFTYHNLTCAGLFVQATEALRITGMELQKLDVVDEVIPVSVLHSVKLGF